MRTTSSPRRRSAILSGGGHIAPGDVDDRSIVDVRADDLRGYSQCHFFAGLGLWSLGFRLAGWPDDRPGWSASAPCQPYSNANTVWKRGKAQQDERHLWPHVHRLAKECRPPIVFGEQVKKAIAYGWLDEVFAGMEELDYACGSTIAAACSVGTPQERERVWFVCTAGSERHQRLGEPATNPATREAVAPWCETVRAGRSYRGKTWLTQPGLCRLVDGHSVNVAALHPIGNAIVAQLAAEFIKATVEALEDLQRLRLNAGVFA